MFTGNSRPTQVTDQSRLPSDKRTLRWFATPDMSGEIFNQRNVTLTAVTLANKAARWKHRPVLR